MGLKIYKYIFKDLKTIKKKIDKHLFFKTLKLLIL